MAKKKLYRFPLYLLARLASGCVYLLPRSWALAFARFGGRIAFQVVGRHREKTLKNLRAVFGKEKTEKEIRQIACHVFEHLAMTAVEIIQFPKLDWEKVSQFVDSEKAIGLYEQILREGKGLITVSAHIGNWELLAATVCLKGLTGGVVARRIYYEPYNRWIVGLRKSVKVPTVYRDGSSRETLKILARNQIVGILPDQNIESLPGVFVDFFGRPAYTPIAPVRLALASGSPIVPTFLIRKGDQTYQFVLGEVIRPQVKTNREEAVQEYTEQWMRSLEKVIREYPDQWAWMHNRWKTQPADERMRSQIGAHS